MDIYHLRNYIYFPFFFWVKVELTRRRNILFFSTVFPNTVFPLPHCDLALDYGGGNSQPHSFALQTLRQQFAMSFEWDVVIIIISIFFQMKSCHYDRLFGYSSSGILWMTVVCCLGCDNSWTRPRISHQPQPVDPWLGIHWFFNINN